MTARVADVVVPVYQDVELTRRCLESVLNCSGDALGTLYVVDDRGPEPGMLPMLRSLRDAHAAVRLLENEANLGFVGAANRGLLVSERDAVVLNADAEVTAGWLEELLLGLDSDPRVAAVCPLSNHGHLCSVPEYNQPTPAEALRGEPLGTEGVPRFSELPTGVGFCLLFRRACLEQLGAFDPRYGRGYNEENDWCQRARAAGYSVLRANRALVLHEGQVSFGGEREELDRYNARRLVGRYPGFLPQARAFDESIDSALAARAVRARTLPVRVMVDARGLAAEAEGEAFRALTAFLEGVSAEPVLQVAVCCPGPGGEGLARRGLAVTDEAGFVGADVVHVVGAPVSRTHARSLVRSSAHLAVTFLDAVAFLVPGFVADPEAAVERRAAALALGQAGAVFAPTAEVKAALVPALGLEASDVRVRPLGGPRSLAVEPEAVRRRLGLERPFVLHLGGDAPWRGLPWLLEAWALAFPGGDGPELVVAGPSCGLPFAAFSSGAPLPTGVRRVALESPDEAAALVAGAVALADLATVPGPGFDARLAEAHGVPVLRVSPGSPAVLAEALARVRSAPRPRPKAFPPAVTFAETWRKLVTRPDEALLARRRRIAALV